MISLNEAAKWGIERVRNPKWASPMDHIEIDVVNGGVGPWLHLYCPFNIECNGRDPVNILFTGCDLDFQEWEPYMGPIPGSVEYEDGVKKYKGCLN